MQKKIWTPDRVIEELKRTRRNGPRSNTKLYDAARHYFGSFRAALLEAGLPCGPPKPPKRDWSKEKVVEKIRERHRIGKSLALTHREDRGLYQAAKRWHGSWTAALSAAGFPKSPRDCYTADEVRLRIIDLYERELPLTRRSHNDPKMRRSCKKHFGGWRKAVESLGLGSELRRMWTPQKVIEAILHRRAEGHDLTATRYEDLGLFAAAKVRFGGWNKALVAAGIEVVLREQWDEEKVLTRIRQLIQEVPIHQIRHVDPKVTSAAKRRFGSIRKAVEVAQSQGAVRKARKAK